MSTPDASDDRIDDGRWVVRLMALGRPQDYEFLRSCISSDIQTPFGCITRQLEANSVRRGGEILRALIMFNTLNVPGSPTN